MVGDILQLPILHQNSFPLLVLVALSGLSWSNCLQKAFGDFVSCKVKHAQERIWVGGESEAHMSSCHCHFEHCVLCELTEVQRGIVRCERQITEALGEMGKLTRRREYKETVESLIYDLSI